ncbi:MAG: acyl carrier protein [Ilumatobacteraceae bacterium]|nr:acyl carrier protein [Ilumatobacteraceae bacterium]
MNHPSPDMTDPDSTTPDDASTTAVVTSFVTQRFPALPDDLATGDSLLESGAVDSLGMLDIVMFVEEKFDIMIDDDELTAEHFETVDSISQLVDSKRS